MAWQFHLGVYGTQGMDQAFVTFGDRYTIFRETAARMVEFVGRRESPVPIDETIEIVRLLEAVRTAQSAEMGVAQRWPTHLTGLRSRAPDATRVVDWTWRGLRRGVTHGMYCRAGDTRPDQRRGAGAGRDDHRTDSRGRAGRDTGRPPEAWWQGDLGGAAAPERAAGGRDRSTAEPRAGLRRTDGVGSVTDRPAGAGRIDADRRRQDLRFQTAPGGEIPRRNGALRRRRQVFHRPGKDAAPARPGVRLLPEDRVN